MDSASEALLIIVSTVLSLFLILLGILLIYFISLMKKINKIAEHAENVADSVESAAQAFGKAASPIAFFKVVGSIIENANKFKSRKKG